MAEGPRKIRFIAEAQDTTLRLDQVLAARVPGLSRRQARVVLDIGGVFIDKQRCKVAGRFLREGQTVDVTVGGALDRATKQTGREARARDDAALPTFSILHEDQHLMVVEKPAGLHTVPTPESDRGNLMHQIEEARGRKPWCVHRLDLMTSGLLVVALTEDANRALSEIFRVHDVDRAYLAIVAGDWPQERVRSDEPISGRHATTHFDVLERRLEATLVRARLETGRSHQIRIHCRSAGHPVMGDPRYGRRTGFDPPRMALHATLLGFLHPATRQPVRFESPFPADLQEWWGQRAP